MAGQCTIFWSSLDEKLLEGSFESQLSRFPPSIQERLNKYPRQQDKHLSLLGKLLLLKVLENHRTNASEIFTKLQYTDKGRPYFENENIDFNISHSANIIVCAFSSDSRVGIDVQKIIPVSRRQAQFFVNFADLEGLDVEQGSAKLIEVWTRKEAVSKVVGDGLSISFRKMLLSEDRYRISEEEDIFIYPCALKKGYSCSLASRGALRKIDINFIPEKDLILEQVLQVP